MHRHDMIILFDEVAFVYSRQEVGGGGGRLFSLQEKSSSLLSCGVENRDNIEIIRDMNISTYRCVPLKILPQQAFNQQTLTI